MSKSLAASSNSPSLPSAQPKQRGEQSVLAPDDPSSSQIPAYPSVSSPSTSTSQTQSDLHRRQHPPHTERATSPTSSSSGNVPRAEPQAQAQAPWQSALSLKQQFRRSLRRPDSLSTNASFVSASNELPAQPPSASSAGSDISPKKKTASKRIGRDFEAILASGETYILRETAGVALGPDEQHQEGDPPSSTYGQSSPNGKRVIVERRTHRPSSSLTSTEFDAIDEQLTPKHADRDTFPSSPSTSTTSPLRSKSAQTKLLNGLSQAPSSPDRSTSLQRHSNRAGVKTLAPTSDPSMSAIPGIIVPPAADGVPPLRPRNRAISSVGLEQEVQGSALALRDRNDQSSGTMGAFRQRMKKTSGFLRKLRGDANQDPKPRPPPISPPPSGRGYTMGSNLSATWSESASIPRSNSGSLSRRDSKTSIGSEGVIDAGVPSTAHSISTSTVKQTAQFESTEDQAVPPVPEKFTSSANTSASERPLESEAETVPDIAGSGLSEHGLNLSAPDPIRRGGSSSRVPSAPVGVAERDTAKVSLPQRSSSQGHERKQLGSGDSTGAIRFAIRNFESEMDDALKESPQDLDRKPNFDTQKQAWGPGPQLPDLDIQRYKERSGSFLEEPEFEHMTPHSSANAGSEASVASQGRRSLPDTPGTTASSPDEARKAIDTSSDIGQHDTTGRNAGASYATADSASTRLGPVSGLRRSNSQNSAISASQVTVPSHAGDLDADKTIKSAKVSDRPTLFKAVPRPLTIAKQSDHREGADTSIESANSARSSRQTSSESLSADNVTNPEKPVQRRTANSGASLTSFKSFETAVESAGNGSADPRISTFAQRAEPSSRDSYESRWKTAELVDEAPSGYSDHGSDKGDSAALTPEDTTIRHQPSEEGHGTADEAQGQSIRLITKASNDEDHKDDTTTPEGTAVLTDPMSSAPSTSVKVPILGLPKIENLPATSVMRPGGGRVASRGGVPLSTSGRYDASLLSSPNSANASSSWPHKTSIDGASRGEMQEDAGSSSYTNNAIDLATKCWAEDPSFLKKEKIAEWLGGLGLVNRAARTHYFSNFDFTGLRVDVAFRKLCDKLFLRAETQQIDRILAAFSQRYFECNPDSVFGSADVVHSVVFSILLLNTDLHIAELQERMTRQQFVRNTMDAIAESNPDVQTPSVTIDDGRSSFSVSINDNASSISRSHDMVPSRSNTSQRRDSFSSNAGGTRVGNGIDPNTPSASVNGHSNTMHSSRLSKAREYELETALKDIYAAVRTERILLPTPETSSGTITGRTSGAFSPVLGGGGRRKMGMGSDRMTALKRGSIRGIQGLLGGLSVQSFEGSLASASLSPKPDLRVSTDSWGRTSQSLARPSESGGRALSPIPPATPGFASTLTQTIIKESQDEDAPMSATSNKKGDKGGILDEEDDDHELALAGPPWAKEGSLTRKHYWEAPGKRAKDKNWTEVFVVVSKGQLSMFRFDSSSASKSKTSSSSAVVVSGGMGGGNWLSSATCLGEVSLSHCLANALPPPGYNRERPHVFALTMPGGGVYFFQTGHEELVHEWVSTCNYWAARTSKEPLPGGVSNMEYGWNKVLPQISYQDEYEELDGEGASVTSSGRGTSLGNSSWSTPPDASIYNGTTLLGQTNHSSSAPPGGNGQVKSFDQRSVRSGKSTSQRSMRSRMYSNLADAASGLISPSTSVGQSTNNGKGKSKSSFSSPAPSVTSSSAGAASANERIFINDWRTPQLPTMPSTLLEESQLTRLENQVKLIESDLTIHNELRTPMLSLYSPRGQNHAKALSNWERKSNYLLQELVKYGVYVEALKKSVELKAEKRGRKEVEGMIEEGDAALAEVQI